MRSALMLRVFTTGIQRIKAGRCSILAPISYLYLLIPAPFFHLAFCSQCS